MFNYVKVLGDIYKSYKDEPMFFVISYHQPFDSMLYDVIYKLKCANRFLKVFVEINESDINSDLKNVIKFATNHYGDGFVINGASASKLKFIKKLEAVLKRLPEPYNFEWDIYLKLDDKFVIYKHDDMSNKIFIGQNHLNYLNISYKSLNSTPETDHVYTIKINVDYF